MLKSFHHIQVFSNVDLDSVSQQKRPQDSSNSSDLTKSEESGKMRFQERVSVFFLEGEEFGEKDSLFHIMLKSFFFCIS